MSLFDLDGKVAVVTGSSRGIGRAIVERLAEHGAQRRRLLAQGARPARRSPPRSTQRHGAGRAIAVAANISSKEDLRGSSRRPTQAFGTIDILVCNAASNPYYGPLAGISDDQFRKILDNNIIANHWLIGFVAPEMKRAQGRRDRHRLLDRRAQGRAP